MACMHAWLEIESQINMLVLELFEKEIHCATPLYPFIGQLVPFQTSVRADLSHLPTVRRGSLIQTHMERRLLAHSRRGMDVFNSSQDPLSRVRWAWYHTLRRLTLDLARILGILFRHIPSSASQPG